jgi:succinate dehydrogenase / fumarate reductase cytochrome b subunit
MGSVVLVPIQVLRSFYASSIGKKIFVALTGIVLLIFLFGHMAGNLLIYAGRDAINSYAEKLQDLGPLLWLARLVLLGSVVLHIVATLQLARANRLAKEHAPACRKTVQATAASLSMVWTGFLIAAFVVYHVLHFTVTPDPAEPGYYELSDHGPRHDVYAMVVAGFRVPLISLFYIASLAALCVHISHGFSSVFQTLGMRTIRNWPLIRGAGIGYAALIFTGNVSIPLSILFGWVS